MRLAESKPVEDVVSDCVLRGATSRELITLAPRPAPESSDEVRIEITPAE